MPTCSLDCFFLTNLEVSVAPSTVADLYRVRWEIELDNKLDKWCSGLDEITTRTGHATRALVACRPGRHLSGPRRLYFFCRALFM